MPDRRARLQDEGVKEMALEHLKDAARVIGLKQVRKAVQGGRAAAVFLADDADARITVPLAELCEAQGVPV